MKGKRRASLRLAVARNLAVALGLVLTGGIWLFREHLLLAVGDFLIVADELRPADVVHVIAGDDYRTAYAIQLYQQGFAKTIFFTGGWCQFHGYTHGEHGRQLALEQGVPPKAIVIDDTAVTSTYGETLRLKAWLEQSPVPVQSVLVVSDPFHMRRARWTARRVLGGEIEIQMAPVPFEAIPYRRAWWTDEKSARYVKEEYLKYLYYIARYQWSRGAVSDWLAALDRE